MKSFYKPIYILLIPVFLIQGCKIYKSHTVAEVQDHRLTGYVPYEGYVLNENVKVRANKTVFHFE